MSGLKESCFQVSRVCSYPYSSESTLVTFCPWREISRDSPVSTGETLPQCDLPCGRGAAPASLQLMPFSLKLLPKTVSASSPSLKLSEQDSFYLSSLLPSNYCLGQTLLPFLTPFLPSPLVSPLPPFWLRELYSSKLRCTQRRKLKISYGKKLIKGTSQTIRRIGSIIKVIKGWTKIKRRRQSREDTIDEEEHEDN